MPGPQWAINWSLFFPFQVRWLDVFSLNCKPQVAVDWSYWSMFQPMICSKKGFRCKPILRADLTLQARSRSRSEGRSKGQWEFPKRFGTFWNYDAGWCRIWLEQRFETAACLEKWLRDETTRCRDSKRAEEATHLGSTKEKWKQHKEFKSSGNACARHSCMQDWKEESERKTTKPIMFAYNPSFSMKVTGDQHGIVVYVLFTSFHIFSHYSLWGLPSENVTSLTSLIGPNLSVFCYAFACAGASSNSNPTAETRQHIRITESLSSYLSWFLGWKTWEWLRYLHRVPSRRSFWTCFTPS